jgi:hypothetical protein
VSAVLKKLNLPKGSDQVNWVGLCVVGWSTEHCDGRNKSNSGLRNRAGSLCCLVFRGTQMNQDEGGIAS